MSNLHNDNQHNIVSFLRQNQPIPPQANTNLEQNIIDALEPQTISKYQQYLKLTQTITNVIALNSPIKFIATGFLFTFVSFGFRTPRIAIEPKDLENFLVKNWQDTLNKRAYSTREDAEAYLLLPNISESQSTLSVSNP